MHKKNIEILKKETIRLITEMKRSVEEIKVYDNPFGNLTKSKVAQIIEVMEGETLKVSNLEATIAVVGTMKAGKSTIINSIVGREVLPNRNSAMTAVPTLIRHVKDQREPVLLFSNSEPLKIQIKEIGKKLSDGREKPLSLQLYKERDGRELIDGIQSDTISIKERYEGEAGIFAFLKIFNDIVRLSRELDIPFPFQEYNEMHEFPVIEVEFTALKHMNASNGDLSLLDTPGPNEANLSSKLTEIIKDQVSKATGVLLVCNFEQMNTEADANTHKIMQDAINLAGDRVYLLLNRYDAKTSNDRQTEDEYKEAMSDIYNGTIPACRIFPTSAIFSLLANRAQTVLDDNRLLSDVKEPWISDFCDKAYPDKEKDELVEVLSNSVRTMKTIQRFHARSLMYEPLQNIILKTYEKAAFVAMHSPLDKITAYYKGTAYSEKPESSGININNYLEVMSEALIRDISELEAAITEIETDIVTIGRLEKKASAETQKAIKKLKAQFEEGLEECTEEIEKSLKSFFKEGKRLNKVAFEAEKKENKESNRNSPLHVFSSIFDSGHTEDSERVFDPESPIIEVQDVKELDALINKINQNVSSIIISGVKILQKLLSESIPEMEDELNNSAVQALSGIIETIRKRFVEKNINLEFHLPRAALQSSKWTQSNFNDIREEKHYQKRVEKDGIGNAWLRFFLGWANSDLGCEYVDRIKYTLNMNAAKKEILAHYSKHHKAQWKSEFETLTGESAAKIQTTFSNFKASLENLRCDFLQGINAKKNSSEEKENDLEMFKQSKKDFLQLNNCVEQVREEIRTGSLEKKL